MRTVAILPVKSFAAAKQRLSPSLGAGSRQALALAMLTDVLASLRRARGIDEVFIVTAEPKVEAAAEGHAVRLLHDPAEAGQSTAVEIGVRHALGDGFDRALLIPGDTPLLDPTEVDAVLERAAERELSAVIVPDRARTGTNGLLLSPPNVVAPSFGPGSLARHIAAAEQAGVRFEVVELPSLMHDVDSPSDLSDLAAVLEERRGLAPLTQGSLRQIGRVRGVAPSNRADERVEA